MHRKENRFVDIFFFSGSAVKRTAQSYAHEVNVYDVFEHRRNL